MWCDVTGRFFEGGQGAERDRGVRELGDVRWGGGWNEVWLVIWLGAGKAGEKAGAVGRCIVRQCVS